MTLLLIVTVLLSANKPSAEQTEESSVVATSGVAVPVAVNKIASRGACQDCDESVHNEAKEEDVEVLRFAFMKREYHSASHVVIDAVHFVDRAFVCYDYIDIDEAVFGSFCQSLQEDCGHAHFHLPDDVLAIARDGDSRVVEVLEITSGPLETH